MRALLVLVTHNLHELVVCTDSAKAENVTKLTAVCQRCLRDASFTQRLSNETKVEVGAISAMVTLAGSRLLGSPHRRRPLLQVIGGSELYIPVCRSCFEESSVPSTGMHNRK
jgi:thymidine kinase